MTHVGGILCPEHPLVCVHVISYRRKFHAFNQTCPRRKRHRVSVDRPIVSYTRAYPKKSAFDQIRCPSAHFFSNDTQITNQSHLPKIIAKGEAREQNFNIVICNETISLRIMPFFFLWGRGQRVTSVAPSD
ncbi:unnamed protein product [Ixodes pacificus]